MYRLHPVHPALRLGLLAIVLSACDADSGKVDVPQDKATLAEAAPVASATSEACPLPANIPHDIVVNGAVGEQETLDQFSWASFNAINSVTKSGPPATPKWATWSSTSDLLNLIKIWYAKGAVSDDYPAFGDRYLRPACQTYCQENPGTCDGLRTLEQVSKVNDAVFEANATGLSANPVIASNGSFVRYEIRINQDMYDLVRTQELYNPAKVAAAEVNATCGVIGGAEGVINAKLAWMDMANLPAGLSKADYYTEKRIVFTSGAQRSDGKNYCEVREVGLVGMHIAHKIQSQMAWAWSTFEHVKNAPDCGSPTSTGVNYGCPAQVTEARNFYAASCKAMPAFNTVKQSTTDPGNPDLDTYFENNTEVSLLAGDACQFCNHVPKTNAPPTKCSQGFCVDQPPAADAGLSRLCRQVPITDPAYASAASQNAACQTALSGSLWKNYLLISTQWYANQAAVGTSCETIAALPHGVQQDGFAKNVRYGKYADDGLTGAQFAPQVSMTSADKRPRLGNTSMESYESSNCVGCHSKAALLTTPVSTAGVASYQTPVQGSNSPTTLTAAPSPLQSDTYSTIKTGTSEWTQWTFTTPSNTYVHTDFSWWMALEVPSDGAK